MACNPAADPDEGWGRIASLAWHGSGLAQGREKKGSWTGPEPALFLMLEGAAILLHRTGSRACGHVRFGPPPGTPCHPTPDPLASPSSHLIPFLPTHHPAPSAKSLPRVSRGSLCGLCDFFTCLRNHLAELGIRAQREGPRLGWRACSGLGRRGSRGSRIHWRPR